MQKKESPIVSVIIPTYNRASFVEYAIRSVLNQTFPDFELLVVDDHSTDSTRKVVENFDDARVVYLENQRSKGAQGARNTGLQAARGKWIAFLDSDDMWLETRLERQMEFIQSLIDPIAVCCGHALYDFDSDEILAVRLPNRAFFEQKDLLYKNYIGGLSTFMFRKDAGLEVGGLDESFPALQDADLYVALSQIGPIHSLNEVLVHTRISNRDRISRNYSKKYSGALRFKNKYDSLLDLRLRNRAFSRLIVFACRARSWKFLKHLHWAIAGAFIDFPNFKWMMKEIING